MKIRGLNKIFFSLWFIGVISTLLTFSLLNYSSQQLLNNPKNISEDVNQINLIDSTENSTSYLLLIFSDAMRFDKLVEADTPNIDILRANGVTLSNYRACLPSYSHVNYVSMMTGSTPNITQAFSNSYSQLVTLPNLFSIAQDAGISTGIVSGSQSWDDLFGEYIDNKLILNHSHDLPDKNVLVKDAAIPYITANFSEIQYIVFDDVDTAGHMYGPQSDEYLTTIENLDIYIGELIDLYDSLGVLDETTICVMSDHGMHDLGDHGGETDQETHASLILSGKGVKDTNLTIAQKIRTNSLAANLLYLFGLTLGPQMNGKIVYEAFTSFPEKQALYSILQSEIMAQQMETSLEKMGLLGGKIRSYYTDKLLDYETGLTSAKSLYNTANYAGSYSESSELEATIRKDFSDLYDIFDRNIILVRASIIIGIFAAISIAIAILYAKIEDRILNKKLIIPQLVGVSAFVIVQTIFTRFHYAPIYVHSVMDLIMPNLYTIIFGSIVVIFLPWLVLFLIDSKRRKERVKFKQWRQDFLKSSIGSMFFVTILGVIFAIFYIISYGPVTNWMIPIMSHYYGFMMIGLISSAIALFALIITASFAINDFLDQRKSITVSEEKTV
ncbi:MAG TPA: alkaline phosphatase [Candidatus Bathyarchaeia archaeon]|nr:alkaline phosphatase [Candidatus Bathyarchaeia archaeon]